MAALGTSWRTKSRRFAASAPLSWLMPVMLPPGRFRLVTRPSWTGSKRAQELPYSSFLELPKQRQSRPIYLGCTSHSGSRNYQQASPI
jgi:hypothetical protein